MKVISKFTILLMTSFLVLAISPSKIFAASGEQVVSVAKESLGKPYAWGGTGPNSFDCSGFSKYVFSKLSITIPRTTIDQFNFGETVQKSQLKKGDMVFFQNTYRAGLSHSGIYVGDNKFIHASSSRGIMISSLSGTYWASKWYGAKRYIEESKLVYDVFHVAKGTIKSFETEQAAVNFGLGTINTSVIDNTNNTTVWTANTIAESQVSRIAGSNRLDTSVKISQQGWSAGAKTVIITNGNEFADALAGAPLAYQLDAPILLTEQNKLSNAVKEEISRLGAKEAIILGGTSAVGDEIKEELRSIGLTVERIAGANRFETAAEISNKMDSEIAIVVNAVAFPDALGVASFAAKNGYPILLTNKDSLPSQTANQLSNFSKVYVIGGDNVVTEKVLKQLPNPQRIAGSNRFETVKEVNAFFEAEPSKIFLATGFNFADALAGSVLAAKENSSIWLVANTSLPEPVAQFINDYNVNSFFILGGESVVSSSVLK